MTIGFVLLAVGVLGISMSIFPPKGMDIFEKNSMMLWGISQCVIGMLLLTSNDLKG